MPSGISIRLLEVGHCVHPGFMVKPGLGWAPKAFPAGVALINHPQQGYILFDTGYHQRFMQCTRHFPERVYALVTPCSLSETETLVSQLAQLAIKPEDINHVVLSHFHADHIAGVCEFNEAKVYCHPDAHHFMTQANRFNRIRKGYLQGLLTPQQLSYAEDLSLTMINHFPLDLANVLGLTTGSLGLQAYDLFGDNALYLVFLPGHAAGQMGLLVRLAEGFLFLLADACWLIDNLRDGVNQHWLANIVCDNRQAYQDTLNKLRTCYEQTKDKVIFLPSHCQETLNQLKQRGWIS
ncbi:MBL fold metallo-hydrolase [Zooshikella ganghwensis]|uniref:MBL fold metallo-hydrolase n=1 Tax=Zooshikella ganghwensis TaxID=202772 RepID=A0A4P9VMA5_9GAMM|nr:MBL fold metallo-hydrolase [Zooshikella ganghwensis]RDH44518.1 MBL fold metallo-hydrolase [Zooshikella ganghwensis]